MQLISTRRGSAFRYDLRAHRIEVRTLQCPHSGSPLIIVDDWTDFPARDRDGNFFVIDPMSWQKGLDEYIVAVPITDIRARHVLHWIMENGIHDYYFGEAKLDGGEHPHNGASWSRPAD